MNIFVLDEHPVKAAQYYCDKHVPKMVVELFQQLGSATIRHGATPEQMPLTSKGTPLRAVIINILVLFGVEIVVSIICGHLHTLLPFAKNILQGLVKFIPVRKVSNTWQKCNI